MVYNKKGIACSVGVKTLNGEAKAGEDFLAIDKVLNFKHGEKQKYFSVAILDDYEWE